MAHENALGRTRRSHHTPGAVRFELRMCTPPVLRPVTTRTNPKYYSLELRARSRLVAERRHRERRRHVMRLRGVERGADVQRRAERAVDFLLDAALPHAKVRRRHGAVADALVRRRVRLQSRPSVAIAPSRLDAAEGYLPADDRMVPIREVGIGGVTRRRYTMTTAPRSTISARPLRPSRTRNGPRGACSAARIRSQWGLRNLCHTREQPSAPARPPRHHHKLIELHV